MIAGAIFDVDGTLLDSMWIWDTIGVDYLRSIGYEPREDLAAVFKDMSLYQAACYYQREYGVALPADGIIAGVNRMIEGYYQEDVQAKPGVGAFLQSLQGQGVPMCICTATDRPLVECALKRLGLLGYFSKIFTCSEVGHGKDQPDIYRQALHWLGTPKARTAVFEDALYAARTAKADGFPIAAVYDRFEPGQAQLHALADWFFPEYPAELPF